MIYYSTLDYVKIGSGVKSIDNSAFAGCSKLTEVDMGDNVTYIGSGVFKDCVSLQSIIIPQVTSIPSNTFYNCYALKQIKIPKTVTSIGNSAFYACYGITDIYYKGDKDAWTAINLGSDNEPLTYGTVHFGELAGVQIVYGDVSGDMNVNVSDAIFVAQALASSAIQLTDEQKTAADVNCDESINVSDLIRLLQHLANPAITLGPSND